MIQLQLPDEMSKFFDDIKAVREKNLEPSTNRQIVIDAVKDLKRCSVRIERLVQILDLQICAHIYHP